MIGKVSIPAADLGRKGREKMFFFMSIFLWGTWHIVFKGHPRTVLHHQRIVYHGTIGRGSSFGVTPLYSCAIRFICVPEEEEEFSGGLFPILQAQMESSLSTFTILFCLVLWQKVAIHKKLIQGEEILFSSVTFNSKIF